jgi:hypothetical protein
MSARKEVDWDEIERGVAARRRKRINMGEAFEDRSPFSRTASGQESTSEGRHRDDLQLVLRRLGRIIEEGTPFSVGVKIGDLEQEVARMLQELPETCDQVDAADSPRVENLRYLVGEFQALDRIIQQLGDAELTSIIRAAHPRMPEASIAKHPLRRLGARALYESSFNDREVRRELWRWCDENFQERSEK